MNKPFPIVGPSSWSVLFREKGINDLFHALRYVRGLKYERISDPSKFELVLTENRGTCSSKHGVVASLAEAEGWDEVQLWNVLYEMKEENTPGVGKVLVEHGLKHLPEAHTILKIKGMVADITGLPAGESTALDAMICEQRITAKELIEGKVEWHQRLMMQWLADQKMVLSFDALWAIREKCISALSE
jgi:hypothetical protein